MKILMFLMFGVCMFITQTLHAVTFSWDINEEVKEVQELGSITGGAIFGSTTQYTAGDFVNTFNGTFDSSSLSGVDKLFTLPTAVGSELFMGASTINTGTSPYWYMVYYNADGSYIVSNMLTVDASEGIVSVENGISGPVGDDYTGSWGTIQIVPEPALTMMFVAGLCALGLRRRNTAL